MSNYLVTYLSILTYLHTYSFFSSLSKTFAQQDVDARARRSLTPKPPPWGRRLGQEDGRRKRRKR